MMFLSLPNKHRSLGLNKPSCNVEESESFSSYSSSSFHRSPSPSPLRRFLRQLGSLIMPCSPTSLYSRIRSWLRDYDRIQSLAVVLIYIQVRRSGVGSFLEFLGFSQQNICLPLAPRQRRPRDPHSLHRRRPGGPRRLRHRRLRRWDRLRRLSALPPRHLQDIEQEGIDLAIDLESDQRGQEGIDLAFYASPSSSSPRLSSSLARIRINHSRRTPMMTTTSTSATSPPSSSSSSPSRPSPQRYRLAEASWDTADDALGLRCERRKKKPSRAPLSHSRSQSPIFPDPST